MKKGLRSLLATATGAALLLGCVNLPAAQAASAGSDFNGAATSDAFIPVDRDIEVSVTLRLKDPATVTAAVTGSITPPGKSGRDVDFDFRPSSASKATETTITGRFGIGKDDPAGDWKLNVSVPRASGTGNNAFVLNVSGKQGITSGGVTPNPVRLVKGKDVKVSVKASVTDADSVSAKLISEESNESYDLGDLERGSDDYYRGSTFFSDDTPPGDWTLEVYANRGGQTLKGVSSFTVVAPAGGASKKTKVRITIKAPAKVRKGASATVSGKVYRGSKGYAKKKLEVYFKTKGTKTYKLLRFVQTNSTGKYAKSFTMKTDGYFRVKAPGTSRTRSALSPQEFVDVR
ncbi:hypothetical protein ACQP2T_48840 [Nonomuraea sp. CA-143628]|uniref:hypothetical protein n=1 Tax=Nonomuraea sp. CA-143628 TaxID=3239997 RepID=UPI003D8C220F